MNYHILPQNKFFDAYIEDIYKLHQEDNNIFWVRGDKGDSVLFNPQRPVTYIGNDRNYITGKLRSIKQQDKLIISWFDLFIGECILNSKTPCCVYSYLMGGDFYNDPVGYHDTWLYDHKTKKIIEKNNIHTINFKRQPHNWYKILKEIQYRKDYKKRIKDAYKQKLKTIARIDYIISGANNEAEINFARRLYPTLRAKYIHGSFDQNVDLAKDFHAQEPFSGNRLLKVWLGNSADPCNNHIDACKYLLKVLPKESTITCPLSYGDPKYSILFQQWAETHLQSKFIPILDFLNRREYIDLLNSMDLMIMYHNRQQAFGNIITSLCLGKPVFLKKNSSIFPMLKSIGIRSIYSTDMLYHGNITHFCENAYLNRTETLSIIQEYYSEQARLNNLKKIIIQPCSI